MTMQRKSVPVPNTWYWQVVVEQLTGHKYRDGTGRCVYCDVSTPLTEEDHFPIPAIFGGTETVPACVFCHRLKDRVSLSALRDYYFCHGGTDSEGTYISHGVRLFLDGVFFPFGYSEGDGYCSVLGDLYGLIQPDHFKTFKPATRLWIACRIREQLESMARYPVYTAKQILPRSTTNNNWYIKHHDNGDTTCEITDVGKEVMREFLLRKVEETKDTEKYNVGDLETYFNNRFREY